MTDTSATAFFRQAADEPKTYRWTQTVQGPMGYEDREHSVQGPLYHGGGVRYRDGQQLKPGRKSNPGWGDDSGKSQHVYFTSDKSTAASYAHQTGGHVFEVEPTGDFKMDHNGNDFKTKHPLNVIRKLHPSEWSDEGGKTAAAAPLAATAFFQQAAGANHGWHQDPDSPHIVRGIVASPEGGVPRHVADRLLNGTADHADVLGLVDTQHVGHFWYTHGPGRSSGIEDSKGYAESNDPLHESHPQHTEPDATHTTGDVGVVMVGHRPHGWNPDDNPDDGLMGNSHLPDHTHVHLHELHYTPDGGRTWHQAPVPPGTVVHTDGADPGRTAAGAFQQTGGVDHLDLYHRTTPEAADAIYRDRRMHSRENLGGRKPLYFSTFRGDEEDAQGRGYGEGVVHVRVPHHLAEIDDEFPSGEEHYSIDQKDLRPEHFVDDRTQHTAAADEVPLLHRGVSVEVDPEELADAHDRGGMTAVHEHIRDRVTSHGEGSVGTHWTADPGVAHKFSQGYQFAGDRESAPHTHIPYSNTMHIPVMMHAKIASEHHETDPHALRDAMVQGHGWTPVKSEDPHEQETLVRPGAPVHVTGMEASLPTRPDWPHHLRSALDNWEHEEWGISVHHPHSWQDIGGAGRHTAAGERKRGVDNEGHEVELHPDDGWSHLDGSVSHDDGTTITDHPVREIRPLGARILHQAAAETGTGMMVAIVPPRGVAEELALPDGEPVGDLHITLAYLGKTADYTPEQVKWLPELVGSWAARQRPFTVRIGGAGKFSSEAEHVLWAAADIPGGAQLHSDLAAFLTGHGYRLPSEHGWTPHLTLAYVNRHFRFLPKVAEHTWTTGSVQVKIGPRRTECPLSGIPR